MGILTLFHKRKTGQAIMDEPIIIKGVNYSSILKALLVFSNAMFNDQDVWDEIYEIGSYLVIKYPYILDGYGELGSYYQAKKEYKKAEEIYLSGLKNADGYDDLSLRLYVESMMSLYSLIPAKAMEAKYYDDMIDALYAKYKHLGISENELWQCKLFRGSINDREAYLAKLP